MKVISWNVNGIRAVHRKGFSGFLKAHRPHILGLQETRARPEQLPAELSTPPRWHTHFVSAERAGYSGVALYARRRPDELRSSLSEPLFDCEGRFQLARFGELLIANVYFPNGNGRDRDNSRIPYKLDFYRRVFSVLEDMGAMERPTLVMGDFNTAHQEIDLARPTQNRETSGFTLVERGELDRWLRAGWVDTFRHFDPRPGHYTWWSQRAGVRARNIGWRIDMVLVSRAALPYVQAAFILPDVTGSDHCPVGVKLDPAVMGGATISSP